MNKEEIHTEKIKAYLAGKLSYEEMHALEKQALEDPFFAEALEGLWQDSERSIKALCQLQKKFVQKEKMAIHKPFLLRYWPAVAAILLVFLGLFFFNRYHRVPLHNTITKTVVQTAESSIAKAKKPTKESIIALDKTNNTSSLAIAKKKELPKHPKLESKKKEIVEAGNQKERTLDNVMLPKAIAKRSYKSVAISQSVKEDSAVSIANLLQGKVAGLNLAKKKNADEPSMSVASNIQMRTLEDTIKPTLPMPEGGWKIFQAYLNKNITAKYKKGPKGIVSLQFDINADGTIKRIEVVKGINQKRNKQAVSLLQNGPKWMSHSPQSQTRKGYCEIVFP